MIYGECTSLTNVHTDNSQLTLQNIYCVAQRTVCYIVYCRSFLSNNFTKEKYFYWSTMYFLDHKRFAVDIDKK